MLPYLIRINMPWGGRISIASYGFMMMIGFLLSLYVLQRRAKKLGIAPETTLNLAITALLCGIIGARVFYVIQFREHYAFAERPLEIFRLDRGGLVFYGGFIGGSLGALAVMLRKKLPILSTLGLVAGTAPLGHAFGRFGCFLNGCCFGRITDSRAGIRFPRIMENANAAGSMLNDGNRHISGSPAFIHHLDLGLAGPADAWSQPVHATQLYAVAYNLVIFGFLTLWFHRRKQPSELIGLYMLTYGTARFFNEMFRVTDPFVAGLSIAQILCIPLALAGAALLICQMKSKAAASISGIAA